MLVPLEACEPRWLGGKGAALRRLLDHGFPVPRAWVVPPPTFAHHLREHGWWDAAARGDPGVDEALLRGPPPLIEAPAPLVAVRSSAVDEDGRTRSMAGQYESVLGVTPGELGRAILRVWASYHAPRARAYRGGGGPADMAVLVQVLVDARTSGVLFTTNPVTGSWRELVIEAVWGLGEPLVSGRVVPDRYVLRRPRRTPRPAQRVLAAVPLRVEEEVVSPQERALVPSEDGVRDVRPEAPLARKLTREDLVRLARWGLRAESLLGGPQDVEWTMDRAGALWMLQSRPITTLARLPRGGATLWTRRFIGERYPAGASPLGWSIVGPVLDWFIAYPETSARYLGGDAPLRLVRGHPYLNVTVFRHLAFKLPGAPPPRFMLEFFPAEEAEAWVRRWAAPPDLRVYGSIFATTFRERRWERFRWNPFTNWRTWDELLATLPTRIATLSAAAPADVPARLVPILRDYVKIHVTSLLFASMAYEIVGAWFPPAERDLLLRPPAGSVTRRVNAELWAVGRDPALLPGFLARHGHRSDASWELWSRRWADAPEDVLAMARLAAEGPDPRAELAEEAAALKGAMDGLGRVDRYGVELTQAYLRLREEQRYHLDAIFHAARRRLQVLGVSLVTRGVLDEVDDLRFLVAEELDGALSDAEMRATVERRRAEPPDPRPPDFLRGDEALPVPAVMGTRLAGIGVSPGVVRGRSRVLRRPEEGAALRPGEILVTRSTDPSWTPLFRRAGGLVLELGGLLSHGSVVAREYRVPAVSSVPGATDLLPTGTELTLDGRAGTVWVHRA